MIFIKDMGVLELRVAQQKPSQTLVIFFLVVGEGNDKTSEGVALIFNIYIHYVYIYIYPCHLTQMLPLSHGFPVKLR